MRILVKLKVKEARSLNFMTSANRGWQTEFPSTLYDSICSLYDLFMAAPFRHALWYSCDRQSCGI